ncbi:MAG: hypothetical protein Ct9H90mP16_20900 [Candidatus Poseidoniales archaeon]|nr:MAG: hypothetical protein Ct9H90mP16_20900 [Candidatus Poseidoniales archaeon]
MGFMDKQIRLEVERKLKRGELRCCVSSSSLEMGIDIGSVGHGHSVRVARFDCNRTSEDWTCWAPCRGHPTRSLLAHFFT